MILTKSIKKVLKEVLVLMTLTALFSIQAVAQSEESNQEERRTAFDACLTELGIQRPEKGQRPQAPDENVREQIDICMAEKGFEPPKHRHGAGPKGNGEDAGGRTFHKRPSGTVGAQ